MKTSISYAGYCILQTNKSILSSSWKLWVIKCRTVRSYRRIITAGLGIFFRSPLAVRDVTWMSDHSMHLAKWIPALEQVTVRHLLKCPPPTSIDMVCCNINFRYCTNSLLMCRGHPMDREGAPWAAGGSFIFEGQKLEGHQFCTILLAALSTSFHSFGCIVEIAQHDLHSKVVWVDLARSNKMYYSQFPICLLVVFFGFFEHQSEYCYGLVPGERGIYSWFICMGVCLTRLSFAKKGTVLGKIVEHMGLCQGKFM